MLCYVKPRDTIWLFFFFNKASILYYQLFFYNANIKKKMHNINILVVKVLKCIMLCRSLIILLRNN